jgi:hypothetical protein
VLRASARAISTYGFAATRPSNCTKQLSPLSRTGSTDAAGTNATISIAFAVGSGIRSSSSSVTATSVSLETSHPSPIPPADTSRSSASQNLLTRTRPGSSIWTW